MFWGALARARFLGALVAMVILTFPQRATSQPAIVSVIPAVTGPQKFRELAVTFSEPVTPSTAGALTHFAFGDGLETLGVTLASPTRVVVRTSRQTSGKTYTLTVTGVQGLDGKFISPGTKTELAVKVFLPVDFGRVTAGFQDDFNSPTRNSHWISRPATEDLYVQTNGVLTVSTMQGDPNHLLYEAPGYSSETQEVLARIKINSHGEGSRAGIAIGGSPTAAHPGEALNLVFVPDARDLGIKASRFRLLNDYDAWGPIVADANSEASSWKKDSWYWVRLRQDTKSLAAGANIHAKAWPADGLTPEPSAWMADWSHQGRSGFAGVQGTSGGSVEFEVDYFLLKAAGLPQIIPSAEAFSTSPGIIITRDATSKTVGRGGAATFNVEAVGQYVDQLIFQWQKAPPGTSSFTPILGAASPQYTTAPVLVSDHRAQFRCVISVPGNAEITRTSAAATLVIDTDPPILVSAGTFRDPTRVTVNFSKPVTTGGPKSHITIDNGVTVTAVSPGLQPTKLILTTTAISSGKSHTLTVSGIQDLHGNLIAPSSKILIAELHPTVTQNDILPLMYLRCTVCHGLRRRDGELDLRTKASMLKGGKSGPAFVPAMPEESVIVQRVVSGKCPPPRRVVEVSVKPMESSEVDLLKKWIEWDAPEIDNEPDLLGNGSAAGASEAARRFWAFQPPQNIEAPRINHPELARNSIDLFVLSKLEEKGLSFSPEAGRAALMRRATFDLCGLPPEPEETDAFLEDSKPGAYERMIDRLLSSARYGERWGRHWLDVAGYADSEGKREQDELRPDAYRYRDYVIQSFNSDKAYDRFLVEQIAGDELADYENANEISDEIYDNLVATGFLRMAPDSTVAAITAFVPDRLDIIADEIQVLGAGVMGLTIGCARCHSHKFDPIPQREYYALAAVLKGAYDEHDWLIPNQRRLPYVSAKERRAWESHENGIKIAIESLRASPKEKAAAEIKQQIASLEGQRLPQPMIRALWDRGEPFPQRLLKRGNYLTPGEVVEPGSISVLARGNPLLEVKPPWPGAKKTGRRLAFAKWLVDPNHPLTARVMVNRLWKHHFENGIVKSLGNFGLNGDPPTHPGLLDWLAREFVRNGWSIKHMHRLIMTSSVYRQSSTTTPERQKVDPANDGLSRFPLKRMEAEVLADALLRVSGRLDETQFGRPDKVNVRADGLVTAVGTSRGWRRSIYVLQRRKEIPTILETFDLPQMNPQCLSRWNSVVATQALHLMNNGMVHELSDSLASRVARSSGNNVTNQIGTLYRITLNRLPTTEEEQIALASLRQLTAKWSEPANHSKVGPEPAQRALANLCHALINSAEFVFID